MRLRELRESRNLTQQQMADALGIPIRTYQNYERGVNEPGADVLCKIADYYDTSVDYIVEYSEVNLPANYFSLSSAEKALVIAYRSLGNADRIVAARVIDALADSTKRDGG